jgi:nickel-dependent lactate racemase
MAGYSGGRKLVAPGIAHATTIQGLHSARILGHPRAALCLLEGNPVCEAQEEILAMAGPALAFNFVIDDGRRPCFASFGEIRASHRAAVSFIEGYCRIPVDRPFPAVITSAAGYPLDATYYQTVKAMVGAAPIVAPGGTLLTVSECSEGLGSADFRASQERLAALGAEGFSREALAKERADVDEWETVMLLKALNGGKGSLYAPGLPAEDRRLTGVRVVDSLEEEMRRIVEAGPQRRVAVIPEGPYVVPYIA